MGRPRSAKLVIATLCVAAAGACDRSSSASADLIDREVFIETYVDLRAAAVQTEEFTLSDERRDQILEVHGVDGESLLRFVDAHGLDVDFMRDVWNEVETRFEERSPTEEDPG